MSNQILDKTFLFRQEFMLNELKFLSMFFIQMFNQFQVQGSGFQGNRKVTSKIFAYVTISPILKRFPTYLI